MDALEGLTIMRKLDCLIQRNKEMSLALLIATVNAVNGHFISYWNGVMWSYFPSSISYWQNGQRGVGSIIEASISLSASHNLKYYSFLCIHHEMTQVTCPYRYTQINSTRITHKLIRYVRVREREQESEEAEKYNNHRPGFVEVFE